MTADEQLERWVTGDSVHNPDTGECCPDFSCCNGMPAVDRTERETFARAYREGRRDIVDGMLIGYLGRAFPDVHVAGSIEGTS